MPGHGDGATAVYQMTIWAVYGQGQAARPPQQRTHRSWREAEVTSTGLAGMSPRVEPLPEALAQVVPAPGREGGGYGVLAGAAGRWPRDPQRQAGQAGRGEVNAFQSFFASDSIRWEGASRVSGTWWSHNQDAGWRCAPKLRDFSPYLLSS